MLVWFNNSSKYSLEFAESPEEGTCKDGYYITHVHELSPFSKAGIKSNDVLCSFDNCTIDNFGECSFEGINDKVHLSDLIQKYKVNQKVPVTFWDSQEKKSKSVEITLNISSNVFEIKKMNFGFEKIDYEIIAGMVIMELTINHLENIKESNVSFNSTIRLLDYIKRENRFKKVLIITDIFQGSYVNSTDNLKVGSLIDKVNNIEVSNLNQFRQAYLNPILINNKYYFSIESKDFNKVIVDMKKIRSEEKILSDRFKFKMSELNKLKNYSNKKYYIN